MEVSAASRHCEVPETQVDLLVGKEKSESLQLSPMLQERQAGPMTTAYYALTVRLELDRKRLPSVT